MPTPKAAASDGMYFPTHLMAPTKGMRPPYLRTVRVVPRATPFSSSQLANLSAFLCTFASIGFRTRSSNAVTGKKVLLQDQ